MKKIQILLFALIMISVAVKVSIAPVDRKAGIQAVGENYGAEKFFRYRVHHVQFKGDAKLTKCSIRSECCEV
ncbi:hypothetical protein [Gramella sp. KN1008]|uniref:hypothetical protein n=1 Tax=Gramella sp. KN1008 TaxID=2529298 RepID=UPI00103F1A86|nr:hypothetical protein [Gramella sp. KN1008]TBW28567.1 hypothetical protein EZJ28_07460 [Gramella sp. KN1008]